MGKGHVLTWGGWGGGRDRWGTDSLWLVINIFLVEGPEVSYFFDKWHLACQTLEYDGAHTPQVDLEVILLALDHLRGLREGSRWESHRPRNQPLIQLVKGHAMCFISQWCIEANVKSSTSLFNSKKNVGATHDLQTSKETISTCMRFTV